MKYRDFREITRKLPYFRSNILAHLEPDDKKLEVQLSQWTKNGYVIKLRQGLYTLSNGERSCSVSEFELANQIYLPSYISLETALSFYGFIPEQVYAITSITTNKTASFTNNFGRFTYKSIKTCAFTAYQQITNQQGNKFIIASPEKALLDFLYFATQHLRKVKKNIFELSFRLQNLEAISCDKLIKTAEIFEQKKILETAKLLAEYVQEEWQSD